MNVSNGLFGPGIFGTGIDLSALDEDTAYRLGVFMGEQLKAAEQRGYDRAASDIAYRIRAELVCCEAPSLGLPVGGPDKDPVHPICYWGEASALIAEGVMKHHD